MDNIDFVFTNECPKMTPRNFWLGNYGKDNEFFEVDIGQIVLIEQIKLKNSRRETFLDS